jgi:hypothetical protein
MLSLPVMLCWIWRLAWIFLILGRCEQHYYGRGGETILNALTLSASIISIPQAHLPPCCLPISSLFFPLHHLIKNSGQDSVWGMCNP